MNDKIDFVIIWVDGNDPKWQEEKNKYTKEVNEDSRDTRYRDWDNLKYWFRAVEECAPWVNKIHFVTCGHLPNFLNVNNPKLNIVNHEDFIPKEYLPTFNSHTIELNLHRIKDLEEKFVYFNDDMFIINKVKPTDFFKKGLPCDMAVFSPAIKEDRNGIGTVVMNNMGIVNEYYNKKAQVKKNLFKFFNIKYGMQNIKNILLMPWRSFTGFYELHLPSSFLKQTYTELWNKENEELNNTSLHKFRDIRQDVSQWLIKDWQLASGNFYPRSHRIGKLHTLNEDSNVEKILSSSKKKYKMICLNDSEHISDTSFKNLKEEVINQFEKFFPNKSSFEI